MENLPADSFILDISTLTTKMVGNYILGKVGTSKILVIPIPDKPVSSEDKLVDMSAFFQRITTMPSREFTHMTISHLQNIIGEHVF